MQYKNIVEALFIDRPNRFIANCRVEGNIIPVHVRNTGRCRELFIPGATVYLEASASGKRKTAYSLIAVKKDERIVNVDSAAPNKALKEALESNSLYLPGLKTPALIRTEAKYGESRFDFYIEAGETKAFAEVKGVTLEEEGVALFPDAPTERGKRHIEELIKAKYEGFETYIIFIVQMKGVFRFSPNIGMHPEFGKVLKKAYNLGVHVLCYDCRVEVSSIAVDSPVPVVLPGAITK